FHAPTKHVLAARRNRTGTWAAAPRLKHEHCPADGSAALPQAGTSLLPKANALLPDAKPPAPTASGPVQTRRGAHAVGGLAILECVKVLKGRPACSGSSR